MTFSNFLLQKGAVIFCFLLSSSIGFAQSDFDLTPIGTYATGIFDEGAAEVVAYDKTEGRVLFTNADANSVGILNIDDPTNPQLIAEIDLSAFGAGVNSVASANGLIAVASEGEEVDDKGSVVFFDVEGNFLAQVEVGFLPDMLTFTNDGTKVLVANEGEPNDDYTIDPEGSVSIIDITNGKVKTITFSKFNRFQSRIEAAGVRIFGPGATVAQDAEPEFIAVSEDDKTAFVALQENNAIVVIDIDRAAIIGAFPLGTKDFSLPGNGFDASNRADDIDIRNWPVFGLYQPDGIATVDIDGQTYVLTANEGDSRDYDGFSEEERVNDLDLDPTAFPNAEDLQDDNNLGRLNITTTLGDTDGDGDYDELYAYGARSFSIWTADGQLVFDSGDDFEQITAQRFPDNFNVSNDNNTLKNRSDDKGPEPEAVTIAKRDGKVYALIGLERIGGIFVYDITDPANATFVSYTNNRNFDADPETPEALDLGVETLIYLPADETPSGDELVVTANEVSGTVSFFLVNASPTAQDIENRTVVLQQDVQFTVAPNPTADFVTISYDLKTAGVVDLYLTDVEGRRILDQQQTYDEAGSYTQHLSTSELSLASGVYFLTLRTEGSLKTIAVRVE